MAEITAANRADVCTYAIVSGVAIDQPVSYFLNQYRDVVG